MNRRKLADGFNKDSNTNPTEKRVVKYTLLPSLKHLSAASIASELWTRDDIQKEVLNKFSSYKFCADFFNTSRIEWEAYPLIENKILREAAKITAMQTGDLLVWISDIIKSMGQEIIKWMDYHDRCVFNMKRFSQTKSVAAKFLDCIRWSSTGRINYIQTVQTMFRKKIHKNWKYRLACIYCLEEEIQTFASTVSPVFFNKRIEAANSFLIHFWNSKFTGNSEYIMTEIQDHENKFEIKRSVYELVLYHSSCNRNKAGVEYIWNKLCDVEKLNNIKTAIKNTQNVDIVCFLLSQLDVEDQQYVLKEFHQKVLKLLLGDWLWIEYFLPTLAQVWDMISGSEFLQMLHIVAGKIKTSKQEYSQYHNYRYIFKKMWKYSPELLKTHLFECVSDRPRLVSIVCLLSLTDHIGLLRYMLFNVTAERKKHLVFCKEVIYECSMLLKNKKWDLLDEVLRITLEHQEDISKFKKKLLYNDSCWMAIDLLEQEEISELEKFLNWVFESEEEMGEFKRNCFAHSEYFSKLLVKTASCEFVNFDVLDNFLTWCFKTDQEIQIFKASDFMKDNLSQIISNLVKRENLRLADQFLKWAFRHENDIDYYKDVFICKNANLLVYLLVRGGVRLLENVLSWCYSNTEDIQLFKTNLLEFRHDTLERMLQELLPDMTELADELLNWCDSSPERIIAFKNMLMLREFSYPIISNRFYWEIIIPWFNPSTETARHLRLLHQGNIPEQFFELMNKFISRHS